MTDARHHSHRSGRLWWRIAVTVCVLAACAAYSALHWKTDSSLLALLPAGADPTVQRASEAIVARLNATMVLTLGPRDPNLATPEREGQALQMSTDLAAALREDPAVADVATGPPDGLQDAFYNLYFPRRFQLLTLDPTQADTVLTPEAIRGRIQRLRRILGSPAGALIRPLAPADPWLTFYDQMRRLRDNGPPQLRIFEGQYLSEDGHAVTLVRFRESHWGSAAQLAFLNRLDTASARITADAAWAKLERSGTNLFSTDAERKIRADVQRIAVVSALGVLVLLVWLFRSLRWPLAAAATPAAGILVGTVVALAVFGELHSLTFAFAAAFIGVGVDYPIHLLCHWQPNQAGADAVRDVRRPLLVSALTTCVGLGALGLSGMIVLEQAAVMSATGIGTAVALTLLLMPIGTAPRGAATRTALAAVLERYFRAQLKGRISLALSVTLACIGVAGLILAEWAPSLDDLAPRDPALLAESQRVQARVGAPSVSQVVVAQGDSFESALQRNDAAYRKLHGLTEAGVLEGFQSLAPFLPSEATQRASWQAATAPEARQATLSALREFGFAAGAMAPFERALTSPQAMPKLTWPTLQEGPIAAVVAPFVVRDGEQILVASFVRNLRNPERLSQELADLEGVALLDQRSLLQRAYQHLRDRVRGLMLLAAGAMALVLGLRFRNARRALAAVVPATLAPAVALGLLGLCGVTLNLFHLLASLVVMAMGMDYGVFIAEGSHTRAWDPAAWGRTWLGIVAAATTTCLSFGLLGLSPIVALASIGQTVCIGMLAAVHLAATTWKLAGGPFDAKPEPLTLLP